MSIEKKTADHAPFHPIIMRFAAKYAGVKYRDFCLDYRKKCFAIKKCADDFSIDWVTVMSDPYAEAESFGLHVEYPIDDLPKVKDVLIDKTNDVKKLKKLKIEDHPRLINRSREIEEYHRLDDKNYFIVGWVEGPMAMYSNLRGLDNACLDLYDAPAAVNNALDVILEVSIDFCTKQIEAGAHCIGIGDAACSQIGPEFYREYIFKREKSLFEHIHSKGALGKLHICGDTSSILPMMIETGANIIDVDHLVERMSDFTKYLTDKQVFSGNSDPVRIIQNGNRDTIQQSVFRCFNEANGRCIVSAGCELTPETSLANFRHFSQAAKMLRQWHRTNIKKKDYIGF